MTWSRRRRGESHANTGAASAVLRARLANGVRVVMCPRNHLARASVAVLFGFGSRHENAASNGIGHVLEHMVFRGSRCHRDATALNAAAEDLGGDLEGATYRDHLLFGTDAHPSRLTDAVEVLADALLYPRYRAFDVERAILREEMLESLDAQGHMVDLDNLAHATIFGHRGLGLPIEGNLSNLEQFETDDLETYRQQRFLASNATVGVAGPLDPERVIETLEKTLGTLPMDPPPPFETARPPTGDPVLRVVRESASQIDIRVSFRAVPVRHARYAEAVLLAGILTDGLASRLHAQLVDRQGLAYALHGGLTTYLDCGLFEFEVSVAPDRGGEALTAILDFARAARRFRYTDEELRRARHRYRCRMEFMQDDPRLLARRHGRALLFGLDQDLDDLEERFAAVDASALRGIARQVFQREGLVVTAAGHLARGQLQRMRNVLGSWC